MLLENPKLVLAFVLTVGFAVSPATAEDAIGVADQPPPEGRFVRAADKFLVPYTETIPGTAVTFRMIPVPAGEFSVGSPADEPGRAEDEGPQRRLAMPAFWIGECEVTWAQYRPYMQLCGVFDRFDDLGLRQLTEANQLDAVTAPSKLYDPSFTYASGDGDQLPAVSMTQYAAKQYTKWLSLLTQDFYRLPTEAEWEYACRAGTETRFATASTQAQLDDSAWHAGNSDGVAHEVRQKLPNAWGLYDMHGNAAEWVLDGYTPDAYAALTSGDQHDPADYIRSAKSKPHVLRGGSCLSDPRDCRSASRQPTNPNDLSSYDPNLPTSPWWYASDESLAIGFRIVRPWPEPHADARNAFWEADRARTAKIADFRIDEEGRGERGLVDPGLVDAINELESTRESSTQSAKEP